jgi:hypothetical protein
VPPPLELPRRPVMKVEATPGGVAALLELGRRVLSSNFQESSGSGSRGHRSRMGVEAAGELGE